jgi:tetratricopeptide (TPR) repeat protein
MVHHQIGLAHLMLKQYRQAKDALSKAIESDPLLAPAFFYRGLAWEKLDRKDNMLIDMDQVVTLAPNAPEAKKAGAILAASGR